MAKIETYFDCDLKKAVQVQPLNGNVFSLDNNGNRIGVRIFDNGVKTTITGTVTGRAILADNSTVNLNGGLTTVNGQSVAYVDVLQGALLIPGTIKITIQLTASGVITTLAAILSTVYQTKTDNVITPSAQVIADWNATISSAIQTQNATISSAIQTQNAAIAAETAARQAADSDLKSALNTTQKVYDDAIREFDTLSDNIATFSSGFYGISDGKISYTSNANRFYFKKDDCEFGEHYVVTALANYVTGIYFILTFDENDYVKRTFKGGSDLIENFDLYIQEDEVGFVVNHTNSTVSTHHVEKASVYGTLELKDYTDLRTSALYTDYHAYKGMVEYAWETYSTLCGYCSKWVADTGIRLSKIKFKMYTQGNAVTSGKWAICVGERAYNSIAANGNITVNISAHTEGTVEINVNDLVIEKNQTIYIIVQFNNAAVIYNGSYTDENYLTWYTANNSTNVFPEQFLAGLYQACAFELSGRSVDSGVDIAIELATEAKEKADIVKKPNIVIGKHLYAFVGDTLQVFFYTIINGYTDDLIVRVTGGKGRVYNRYWEYTPVAGDVGNTTITFAIYTLDGILIDSKAVTLTTVSATNKTKNILCVGDSLMMDGQIPIETSRRLKNTAGVATSPEALSLTGYTMVGRKQNQAGTVGWEGTGGWTFANYTGAGSPAARFAVTDVNSISVGDIVQIPATNATGYYRFQVAEVNVTGTSGNIRCMFYNTPYQSTFLSEVSQTGQITTTGGTTVCNYTSVTVENYQPFWNNTSNEFDILTYADTYCDDTIDAVYILLGTNSLYNLSPFASVDSVINDCKSLLRLIHGQLSDAIILLSTEVFQSQYSGLALSYATNMAFGQYTKDGINRLYMNFNEALIALEDDDEFSSYVKIINTHAQFDADYAFPSTQKAVDTRCSETEKQDTNGSHPMNEGYWMIADAQMRAILAVL